MNEHASPRNRKHILFSIKLAVVMVGSALLLTLARKQGWIDADQVVRGYNIVMGLALAAYGNVMPKMMHPMPPRSIHEATLAQSIARVSSWSMTLAFLAWAALWAFAPMDVARIGALAAVGTSVVVMLGYTAWRCLGRRGTGPR
ncbi:hypothetical protein ACYX7E_04575 [Luteimonas sp. RIT-PG2_3]